MRYYVMMGVGTSLCFMFVCSVNVRVCCVTGFVCAVVRSVVDVKCDAVWLLFAMCLSVCVFV